MKEYLKMSDVFNACDVVETDVKVLYAVTEEYDDGVTPHEYAHHAIQYHDELVQMNKELLAALELAREDTVYVSSGITHSTWRCLQAKNAKLVIDAVIAKAKGCA